MSSDNFRWVADIPIEGRFYRGRKNEDRVEKALEFLLQIGEIHHYCRSDPGLQLDRIRIDFLVWPEKSNWICALQVKSSEAFKEVHEEQDELEIPCVVVLDTDEESDLCEKIMSALGLSTMKLRGYIQERCGISVEELVEAMQEE